MMKAISAIHLVIICSITYLGKVHKLGYIKSTEYTGNAPYARTPYDSTVTSGVLKMSPNKSHSN